MLKIIGIERPADVLDDDKRMLVETYFSSVQEFFKDNPSTTMYKENRKQEREREPLRDAVQTSLLASTMMQHSTVLNPSGSGDRDGPLSVLIAIAALTEALNLQDPLVISAIAINNKFTVSANISKKLSCPKQSFSSMSPFYRMQHFSGHKLHIPLYDNGGSTSQGINVAASISTQHGK